MNQKIEIPESDYQITAIRSSGPGGQNVNKVATAIQLAFDIPNSSLAETVKEKLLKVSDKRISQEGVLMIRVDSHRSQLKNREEAVRRLEIFIKKATQKRKRRIPTKPSKASKLNRLQTKNQRSQIKKWRRKPGQDD